ncbi:MAG: SGNH/GDSL hydrolase family protein [bacterium]
MKPPRFDWLRSRAPDVGCARTQSLRLAGGLAIAIAATSGSPAWAQDGKAYRLPPRAGKVLERAFQRAPELVLKGARIEPDRVTARVCRETQCFSLTLDRPAASCPGLSAGPWCVGWSGPAPPIPVLNALRRALGPDRLTDVWVRAGPSRPAQVRPPPKPPTPRSPVGIPQEALGGFSSDTIAYLVALIYLVFPLGFGALLGLGLRRYRPGRFASRWAALGLLLGPALLMALPASQLRAGFWDLLLLSLLLGAGLWFGAHPAARRMDPRSLAVVGIASLIGLVILELGVRWLLPTPPTFPPARQAKLIPTVVRWSAEDAKTWAYVYPDQYPDAFARLTREAGGKRYRFAHVGDSMVAGSFVARQLRFTARLARLDPGVAHLNGGAPGTGSDFHFMLIKAWVSRVPIDHVVQYVFVGNDLVDVDQPYAACDDGPILRYDRGRAEPRCPTPRWGKSVTRLLYSGPAPYPLRVATSFSHAARHIYALLWRVGRGQLFYRPPIDQSWRRFEMSLQATRDLLRNKRLRHTLVLLPYRAHLERSQTLDKVERRVRPRTREICRRLGVRTLDAWDLFLPLVRKHGSRRYFINDPPGDVHFSPEGHAVLAQWLATRLELTHQAPRRLDR